MAIIRVECIEEDGIQSLPELYETPVWVGEQLLFSKPTCFAVKLGRLYEAIQKRENYYQFNTPTAYGDPEYRELMGTMRGIAFGLGCEIIEDSRYITVLKGNRKLMIIQRPQKTKAYHDAVKDVKETFEAFGISVNPFLF